jgi:hypothetical protein
LKNFQSSPLPRFCIERTNRDARAVTSNWIVFIARLDSARSRTFKNTFDAPLLNESQRRLSEPA